jgi:hypothetical protein
MVELFAQVWFLCAIAFLAGSAVTWLLFVRKPRRRARRRASAAPWVPRRATGTPRHGRAAPPEPSPPTEPALANLDTHGGDPAARRAGSSAAGALDRLGVAGGSRRKDDSAASTPEIPAQGGPVDEPAAGDSR